MSPLKTVAASAIVYLLAGMPGIAAQTPSHPRTTSCADSQSPDTTVYGVQDLTELPVLRHGPDRFAPTVLLAPGHHVHTQWRFIVLSNGKVDPGSVQAVDSTGTTFDADARGMVKTLSFWPGCRYTQAVRVSIEFPVNYDFR